MKAIYIKPESSVYVLRTESNLLNNTSLKLTTDDVDDATQILGKPNDTFSE